MKTFIYTLTDPFTNQVRYIGKTINLQRRYYQHCNKKILQKNKTYKNNWILNILNKNSKPIIDIIDDTSEDNWEQLEKYWIEQFRQWGFNLTNLAEGGQGCSGYKWTEQMKANQSKRLSGKISPLRGTKRDKTICNKIKKARTGVKMSDITKLKISISNKNHLLGIKHVGNRLLKSQTCMVKAYNAKKRKIKLLDMGGEEINRFNSISEAAKHYSISTGFINNCLAKRTNSTLGIWQYV